MRDSHRKKADTEDKTADRTAKALERIADVLEWYQKAREEYEREQALAKEEEALVPEEPEVPTEIKLATPEELATNIIDFAKKEFPDDKEINIGRISSMFWTSKGLSRFGETPEIQLKIEKADMLARRQIDKEREIKHKEQIEKEKTGLPSLISSCVDWANDKGLKSVAQADIDAFLLEKGLEVLPETKRSIWTMAKVQMKSKSL